MKEFTKTLKLYFHRDRAMASLSIRCSATHVLTFYIDQPTFEKILSDYRGPQGAEVGPYFVMKKSEYVRFSFSHHHGPQENLRIAIPKWETMVADFQNQMTGTQSTLITCEVD